MGKGMRNKLKRKEGKKVCVSKQTHPLMMNNPANVKKFMEIAKGK